MSDPEIRHETKEAASWQQQFLLESKTDSIETCKTFFLLKIWILAALLKPVFCTIVMDTTYIDFVSSSHSNGVFVVFTPFVLEIVSLFTWTHLCVR